MITITYRIIHFIPFIHLVDAFLEKNNLVDHFHFITSGIAFYIIINVI